MYWTMNGEAELVEQMYQSVKKSLINSSRY
jgi:hypothetical protein